MCPYYKKINDIVPVAYLRMWLMFSIMYPSVFWQYKNLKVFNKNTISN